jgi:hypothetical protein
VSAFNANNSLLQAATIDYEGDTEKMSKKVTKYFAKPVLGNKSSVWWEGFEQFIPSKYLKLFSEYVMCLSCSKLANNPKSGIVKIGLSQSTSNFELTRNTTILLNMRQSPIDLISRIHNQLPMESSPH